MANITAQEVLTMVDTLLPNQYTAEEKMRWLTQAEGYVLREICGEGDALPSLTAGSVLTVEVPYDELYRHYLETQIHYANGETARFNNAAAAWNSGFIAYRDYLARQELPHAAARALRLC